MSFCRIERSYWEQERKKRIYHDRAAGSVYLCACLHLKSKFNYPILLVNDTIDVPHGRVHWIAGITQGHKCTRTARRDFEFLFYKSIFFNDAFVGDDEIWFKKYLLKRSRIKLIFFFLNNGHISFTPQAMDDWKNVSYLEPWPNQ